MPASLTQQRAIAYAPKPFAILSILSSLYVFYYLLIRHRLKLKRIYHRLVIAAFYNVFICSICFFIGSWALPADSGVVGASGTTTSCAVQGAVLIFGRLALASYYAAFSIYGLVAVKNNFRQDEIKWLEKWIHLWALGVPIACLVAGGIYMSMNKESNPYCNATKLMLHYAEPSLNSVICGSLVLINFIIGAVTILYLLQNFSKIQKQVDDASGMRRLIESARQKRHQEVTQQIGLYLFLFSYSYFIPIVSMWIDIATRGNSVYYLGILGSCMAASQGVIFLIIYFMLQKPELELKDLTGYYASKSSIHYKNNTVQEIRENAKQMSRRKTLLPRFSFCIFDGEPVSIFDLYNCNASLLSSNNYADIIHSILLFECQG